MPEEVHDETKLVQDVDLGMLTTNKGVNHVMTRCEGAKGEIERRATTTADAARIWNAELDEAKRRKLVTLAATLGASDQGKRCRPGTIPCVITLLPPCAIAMAHHDMTMLASSHATMLSPAT